METNLKSTPHKGPSGPFFLDFFSEDLKYFVDTFTALCHNTYIETTEVIVMQSNLAQAIQLLKVRGIPESVSKAPLQRRFGGNLHYVPKHHEVWVDKVHHYVPTKGQLWAQQQLIG